MSRDAAHVQHRLPRHTLLEALGHPAISHAVENSRTPLSGIKKLPQRNPLLLQFGLRDSLGD